MVSAFTDEFEKIAGVKQAGVFQAAGKFLAGKGAKTIAPAANAASPGIARATSQVVEHGAPAVAAGASQTNLRKAAPYLAAAGAGAIGFQQARKSAKDWETGRAMRLQQEAYSPT